MPLAPSPLRTRPKPALKFVIIGGRLEDDNRQIYREMRRLCVGRILILPTASSEPVEVGGETLAAFQMHGFQAEVLPVTEENAPAMAHDPAVLAKLRAYGSVYFTGGDQSKILAALKPNGVETPLLKTLREVHRAGGLLAGSSAGAAMMSGPMISGGTSFEAMFSGITDDWDEPGLILGRGLNFFPHGLVDQHVIKRGRLARMVVALAATGTRRAVGIDENTALVIDGAEGRVVGEYGAFFIDGRGAKFDLENARFDDVRLSYIDDGDTFTVPGFAVKPSESKRRVRKTEIAYQAPARSRRNAFGAYALYDLIARLVLGDQTTYAQDHLSAVDMKSNRMTTATIARRKGVSRCLISTPDEGVRITALNLRLSLSVEEVSTELLDSRGQRGIRTFGMDLNERSQIILLGSSPLYNTRAQQDELIALIGQGPVGVIAAASAEARRTAKEHVAFLSERGVEAVDLGITIDNVDYLEKDEEALARITDMKVLFLCGGNQIRLVETLLHRGEESAVLRALAKAYANGATIVAASGAVSALSRLMIAGGSSYEAMRYGVASDLGHQGLVIQEGIGLLSAGVADQNIISGRRLGRLVIACAEENESFGIGVCDESAVVATKSSRELLAVGRYGFVLVDLSSTDTQYGQAGFVAKGVRIRMLGTGDKINLTTAHIDRAPAPHPDAKTTFDRLLGELMRDSDELNRFDHASPEGGKRHAIQARLTRTDDLSAILDLECAREEYDS